MNPLQPDAAWHGLRGEVLQRTTQIEDQQSAHPGPELVRPVIEAWRSICKDSSPEALMFPTFGRGDRKGQAVPRDGKNFLRCRIRPVSRKLGIPDRLVTFQVMHRTMVTDMQHHGTLKDTQGVLRQPASRPLAMCTCKSSMRALRGRQAPGRQRCWA